MAHAGPRLGRHRPPDHLRDRVPGAGISCPGASQGDHPAGPDFDTFAEACSWPERPRRRATEHYVNLPRDAEGFTNDPCPLADKCVVSAIEKDLAVLSSSGASEEEKLEALKYLGHWVGDVHQPLQGVPGDAYTVAGDLLDGVTDQDRATWRASRPIDWANESFAISVSQELGYCVGTDGGCWYDTANERLDEGEPERTVVVDRSYVETHTPIVRDRLVKAGVRLGGLLNRALED